MLTKGKGKSFRAQNRGVSQEKGVAVISRTDETNGDQVSNVDFLLSICLLLLHQTMMLDKWKVCQKTEGESNFLVFSQMLAGISTEMR